MKAKYIQEGKASPAEVEQIFEFVQANPDCNLSAIVSGTGLGLLKVRAALRHLEGQKRVARKENVIRRTTTVRALEAAEIPLTSDKPIDILKTPSLTVNAQQGGRE